MDSEWGVISAVSGCDGYIVKGLSNPNGVTVQQEGREKGQQTTQFNGECQHHLPGIDQQTTQPGSTDPEQQTKQRTPFQ